MYGIESLLSQEYNRVYSTMVDSTIPDKIIRPLAPAMLDLGHMLSIESLSNTQYSPSIPLWSIVHVLTANGRRKGSQLDPLQS